MVVLDTDIIIDVMHGMPSSVKAVGHVIDSAEPTSISVVTRMQLFHGVARTGRPEWERRKIAHALRGVVEYDVSPAIAQLAGYLDGSLAAQGQQIGPLDTLIAATAVHHGEPLMTRNVRHFARIPDVELRQVENTD